VGVLVFDKESEGEVEKKEGAGVEGYVQPGRDGFFFGGRGCHFRGIRDGTIGVDGDDRCVFRTQVIIFQGGLRHQLALGGDFEEGLLFRTIAGRLGEGDIVCVANVLLSLGPALFAIPRWLRLCHAQVKCGECGSLWIMEAGSREVGKSSFLPRLLQPSALKAGTASLRHYQSFIVPRLRDSNCSAQWSSPYLFSLLYLYS